MFGRKANPPASNRPAGAGRRSLPQFGLMIPDLNNMDDGMDELSDDDDALEAELLALTGGAPKPRKQPQAPVNPSNLDKMIQDSLRDIPSDEEVSSGEDDPSILAELQELQVGSTAVVNDVVPSVTNESDSVKSLLMDRMKMYEIAEQHAKNANDTSKARRMNRGLATLKDLLRQVNAGRKINEDEIPPVVSVGASKSAPSVPQNEHSDHELPPASPTDSVAQEVPEVPPRKVKHSAPSSNDTSDEPELKMKAQEEADRLDIVKPERDTGVQNVDILKQRQDEYKKAAVEAKRNGDIQTALSYVKIVKQFDLMMNTAKEGAIVDLSSIPPPLNTTESNTSIYTTKSPTTLQKQDSVKLTSSNPEEVPQPVPSVPVAEPYVPPKTVMEALEQRLKKFQESEEAAKKENNASKARRLGRVVQQYKDAIKLHKAGKAIPIDELPTPPGFAPIPTDDGPSKAVPSSPPQLPAVSPPVTEKKSPQPAPAPPPERNRSAGAVTRNDKQLQAVLERQKLFKIAALKAKQNGDIEVAKEYLRVAKGFEPMIEASKCGLPVDLTSLPIPPNDKASLESSYEVVRLNDCIEGTDLDVYNKLQTDLQQQLEMCIRTRDHFKAMGDIANANRLEQLALQTKKDLKFVQLAANSNLRVPKFHYETKPFTIVQCNTDLTDNDIEVNIIQGINYNVPNPKEVDTYVKVHFPFPSEAPPHYKTAVIYNTNNPVYNATTTFGIQRNSRSCRRIFLRQAVKCEVWSKGGFFRSDSLIGTVNAKLTPLETQCTVHDAFDLMDGRKTVGGKLELKMRVRDPIVKKQVEHVEEKWLIIDT